MGAQQSSYGAAGSDDPGNHTWEKKTCCYKILGVDRSADDAEIRRAYKQKALELHPDRNLNDVENATKRFAEVQAAYDIVSDPEERRWYDSHRDAILRGDADADADDDPPKHYNIRLTTTEEIIAVIGLLNRSVSFDDSPSGFFGILNVTFGQLATEEAAACDWENQIPVEYPSFGASGDDPDFFVKPFYIAWQTFSTKKSFSWKDKWRLSEAPDRKVRRFMEKDNKKLRDDAIRDFNNAVKSLVAFVRKRDPRYAPNKHSEAERQKILRDSATAQARRARAANQQKLRNAYIAEWAQSRQDGSEYNDEFATSGEEPEVYHFECAVCDKLFKSEKQYRAHEKNRKHVKALQQLKRQVKREDFELDLEETADEIAGIRVPKTALGDAKEWKQEPATQLGCKSHENLEVDDGDLSSDNLSGGLISGEVTINRSPPRLKDESSIHDNVNEVMPMPEVNEMMLEGNLGRKKVGKAKAKRAKRTSKQAVQEQDLQCGTCAKILESRNQLFKHIRDEGHAEPKPNSKFVKAGR